MSDSPEVRLFVVDQTPHPASFVATISDDDEMYRFALGNLKGDATRAGIRYLSQGRRIYDNLRQIISWYYGPTNSQRTFLDFAAGFGRFTRYAAQHFNQGNVFATEINRSAVEFQQRVLDVDAAVTTHDPQEYQPGRTYDCVYAGSLFTHLPHARGLQWLRRLIDVTAPKGLLIFSMLDVSDLHPNVVVPAKGFVYRRMSEIPELSPDEYGTLWIREDVVRRMVADALGDRPFKLQRVPLGLCGHQDLYVLAFNESTDFGTLAFSHSPEGKIDTRQVVDEKGIVKGWCGDLNTPPVDVQPVLIGTGDITLGRPIVGAKNILTGRGFEVTFDLTRATDAPTLLKLKKPDGLERVLDIAPPRKFATA